MLTRRGILAGLFVAPAVITRPGLLMPARRVPVLRGPRLYRILARIHDELHVGISDDPSLPVAAECLNWPLDSTQMRPPYCASQTPNPCTT